MNQEGVDIRGPVGRNLGRRDRSHNVRHRTARESKNSSLPGVVTERGKLLTSDLEDRISPRGSGSVGVVDG